MSSKKLRNKAKKLQKEINRVDILTRESASVRGQALGFLLGVGINFNSVKGWKLKKLILSWLGKGQFLKLGSLFIVKKTLALGVFVTGLAFVYGYYKKRKSLIPMAESRFDAVTMSPSLLSKKIEIRKSDITAFTFEKKKRDTYKAKVIISLKNEGRPIKIKFSETKKCIDNLLAFSKKNVYFNISVKET